jgi:hypothetical protein
MAIIRKKLWPKWFNIMKKERQNAELRLADFRLKKGDVLMLEEWDPKKKEYTGKLLRKRVKKVIKLNLLDFYTAKDLKKYGCYLIEF